MPLAVSLALAFSAVTASAAPATTVPVMPPQAQTVREYVAEYFADVPIMVAIARCESTFRQFDKDGTTHRGRVNDLDLGVMQVNEYYHGDTAEKLGIDLHTLEGNVAYARYLYEKEGTTPWNSSKPCWGKSKAAQDLALSK